MQHRKATDQLLAVKGFYNPNKVEIRDLTSMDFVIAHHGPMLRKLGLVRPEHRNLIGRYHSLFVCTTVTVAVSYLN